MTTAFTSISPSHAIGDAQQAAVASWIAHGLNAVSVNSPAEIAKLKPTYPCEFLACYRTMEGTMKAPYVPINAFIDIAKAQGLPHIMLINSDIVLNDPDKVLRKYVEQSERGLIFANRHDHNGDFNDPTIYPHGFDVFIIHSKWYHLIPQSLFAMGQTWWDYWIPYRFIMSGAPIIKVKEPIFLHQRHQLQYHQTEWERMTAHFQWMEGRHGQRPLTGRNCQQVTNEVFKMIQQHSK